MPKETNQSSQWTGGRPIMRRAVVTAKKVVMVNTGDCLTPKVKPSLTILDLSDAPHFSTNSSSLGTHQGVQVMIALPKTALQTQGYLQPDRNEGRRNEGRRNKACQSEGC